MADQPGPVTSNVQCLKTNWNKCVRCRVDTPDVVRCPANSKHDADGVGNKTITEISMGFDRVGCLSKTFNLSWLDDGVSIEAIFRQHKAEWHDSCKMQFNKTTLQRQEKRKSHIIDNTDLMIAQEANYHTPCMVTLYNEARELAAAVERDVNSDVGGCLGDLVHIQTIPPLLSYKSSFLMGL